MQKAEVDLIAKALDDQVEALISASRGAAAAYRQRFRFSLAIGNAAGLVYVGATLTSGNSILELWQVLPSAWCFFTGIVAGAAMLFVASLASTTTSNRWSAHRLRSADERLQELKTELVAPGGSVSAREEVSAADTETNMTKVSRRYGTLALVLEAVSAAGFLAGAVYPLIVLSTQTRLGF